MKKQPHYQQYVLALVFIIGIFSFLSGCIETNENDTLSVLVTIVPQQEMVSFIGGDFVDVTVLVPAGESPHSFEPTPHQMTKVALASAYFKVGSGVEFEQIHMATILEQNPDLRVFDCSKQIAVISLDEHYGKKLHHQDKEDNDHNHEGTDPHIWTSPLNMKEMAETVYEGLVEIDSDHQKHYYANYMNYSTHLDSLHQNISTLLEPCQNKSFMVYHPAWGYFGDTYQLKMIAIEDEGKKPGPAGVAAIVQQARNESINVIFVSPQFDTSSAETIAEEINGKVVFANPLMTNYEHTLTNLAEAIVEGYS